MRIPGLKDREFSRDYQPPAETTVLTVGDRVVGTTCNYVVYSGLPKTGKSTYVTGLIASAFTPFPIFTQKVYLPGTRRRVALFDTESAAYDLARTRDRITHLAKLATLPDRMDIFTLREDPPAVNRAFIESYLKETPECAIAVIDGVLDLCVDYNDVTQTREVTDYLKRITKVYDVCLVLVLHLSKNTGETLGHLGANTDRWAQSTVTVEKVKDTRQMILKPKFLRSADDFDPVAIRYDGDMKKWTEELYTPPPAPEKKGPGRPKKQT
jgi:hypothetical protein